MKPWRIFLLFLLIPHSMHAQFPREGIYSAFVLQANRDNLKRRLYDVTTAQSFALPLNLETQYRYQSAFWSVSQFMIYNDTVAAGFRKIFAAYHDSLDLETRRSFLEALYAVHPSAFTPDMKRIYRIEQDPKCFAMILLWLLREQPSGKAEWLREAREKATAAPGNILLGALTRYMASEPGKNALPPIDDLFAWQQVHKYKMVYSFQQWNRDYPGLAVIQGTDGRFVRDEKGIPVVIQQLARAASGLPYFITNGNTPQGIYSITGIDTSTNNFIGPTPNLQMILPHEIWWNMFFHDSVDTLDPRLAYQQLLPPTWRNYAPVYESFDAGRIGRSEIIAHGTTIDPAYFFGKPYYPISPTLGCLCAREIWDPRSGRISDSEQLKLANAFMKSGNGTGYLVVINLHNRNRPLIPEDIVPVIDAFERKLNIDGNTKH